MQTTYACGACIEGGSATFCRSIRGRRRRQLHSLRLPSRAGAREARADDLLGVQLKDGQPLAILRHRLRDRRSEEHTSELQSQSNLVCRLLLEKKKDCIFS